MKFVFNKPNVSTAQNLVPQKKMPHSFPRALNSKVCLVTSLAPKMVDLLFMTLEKLDYIPCGSCVIRAIFGVTQLFQTQIQLKLKILPRLLFTADVWISW